MVPPESAPPDPPPSDRVEALRQAIAHHDRLYHQSDQTELPDADYDALVAELRDLEERYPALRTAGSPTQTVGAPPSPAFAPVSHPSPMLSLENVVSQAQLAAWLQRVRASLGHSPECVGELKLDGVAVSLLYQEGRLQRAATRGDGETGEDITANVAAIASVPARLTLARPPQRLEVRGEIVMPYASFQTLNAQLLAEGRRPLANPRNATAGSLRQKDPSVPGRRGLVFSAYSATVLSQEFRFQHQSEALDYLRQAGVPVNDILVTSDRLETLHAFCLTWQRKRQALDFAIDGVVLKVNALSLQQRLGQTTKAPRWAVAYKFPPQERSTRLLDIVVSIGRSGKATPFAILDPVVVDGSRIKMATLHNQDQVQIKDLRPGDTVIVRKAGEVIPEVVGPVLSLRPEGLPPWTFPSHCPDCSLPLTRREGESDTFCLNAECPKQREQRLVHFASRPAMDIDHLGESTAALLMRQGLVQSPADLYRLQEADLIPLEGFGPNSARQLIQAIARSKQQPLSRLLIALGIRHLGAAGARALARAFGHLDALLAASPETIAAVDGLGTVIAESVTDHWKRPAEAQLIADLRQAGLRLDEPQARLTEGPLQGMALVVTGTLESFTRQGAEDAILSRGGQCPSSVSSKTHALVVGQAPGASKLNKARALGLPLLDEPAFLRLLETGQLPQGESTRQDHPPKRRRKKLVPDASVSRSD